MSEQQSPSPLDTRPVSRLDQRPPSLPPESRRFDPYVVGMASLVVIVLAGFGAIILGWRSVAATLIEGGQLPGLVSGSITGVALIAVGSALAVIFHGRRSEAILRAETERVVAASVVILRGLEDGAER